MWTQAVITVTCCALPAPAARRTEGKVKEGGAYLLLWWAAEQIVFLWRLNDWKPCTLYTLYMLYTYTCSTCSSSRLWQPSCGNFSGGSATFSVLLRGSKTLWQWTRRDSLLLLHSASLPNTSVILSSRSDRKTLLCSSLYRHVVLVNIVWQSARSSCSFKTTSDLCLERLEDPFPPSWSWGRRRPLSSNDSIICNIDSESKPHWALH